MDIYYALAEEKRRIILEEIARQGEMTVSEITKLFDITTAAISQHLKVLTEAGLVNRKKKAQQRLYSLNTAKVEELEVWAKDLKGMWEERFDNLERYLTETD